MGTFVSISGGGNANVHIYGNGSVVASGGNDTFSYSQVPGSDAVAAGNGNDTISLDRGGSVTVGAGNDSINLNGPGFILQHNSGSMIGNDTINLGSGNDTLTEAGRATVHGAFGSATVEGGKFQFLQTADTSGGGAAGIWHADAGHSGFAGGGNNAVNAAPQYVYQDLAINGNATLVGGDHSTQFIGGSGSVVMQGGTGNDTFMGGSGNATMTGGTGHNLFDFAFQAKGGTDVITNFVSGHDALYLEGQSLGYLQSNNDITTHGGNTYISLDGGQTTVELKGFTGHLSGSDIAPKG
jgi:Ca2+-binding RTX toxin-like protein